MTLLTASFEGPVTLPSTANSYHNFSMDQDQKGRGLPKDGLPRISTEGARILIEGLRGDFSRWVWGIGNHPMELPQEYCRNIHIRAMKDEPHFIASFWFGNTYPQTTKNLVLTPNYCFDQVDTLKIEPGRFETMETDPFNHVTLSDHLLLRQTSDYWSRCSIMLDDNGVIRNGCIEDDLETDADEEDEEEPCPLKIEERIHRTTLDAWMGAD